MKCAVRFLASAVLAALCGTRVQAEIKVTLTDMHLCCKGCTMAVEKAASAIEGVKCVCNKDEASAEITAPDVKAAQQAVDEIAKAGLCGKPDSKEVKFAIPKTPEGKVARLEVAHIHNCCEGCNDAIEGALLSVDGVTGETVEPKKDSFVIEGDFVAADAIKAIMEAGLYPATEKPKK